METSLRIYESLKDFWKLYNDHPFVQGMANGTLSIEQFKFYIVQDHLYLMQYAKIFAMALIKADNEDDMRIFAKLINGTLDVENALHREYIAKLNLTNEDLAKAKPSIVNESYTNYMISIALKEDIPSILAAVLACSWTYKLIGDYLEEYPGALEDPFYGNWSAQYCSKLYRDSNDLTIELFDRYTKGCSKEEYEKYLHIIDTCSQYEMAFWDMAWNLKMRDYE